LADEGRYLLSSVAWSRWSALSILSLFHSTAMVSCLEGPSSMNLIFGTSSNLVRPFIRSGVVATGSLSFYFPLCGKPLPSRSPCFRPHFCPLSFRRYVSPSSNLYWSHCRSLGKVPAKEEFHPLGFVLSQLVIPTFHHLSDFCGPLSLGKDLTYW
jgi:hypothetical protein